MGTVARPCSLGTGPACSAVDGVRRACAALQPSRSRRSRRTSASLVLEQRIPREFRCLAASGGNDEAARRSTTKAKASSAVSESGALKTDARGRSGAGSGSGGGNGMAQSRAGNPASVSGAGKGASKQPGAAAATSSDTVPRGNPMGKKVR